MCNHCLGNVVLSKTKNGWRFWWCFGAWCLLEQLVQLRIPLRQRYWNWCCAFQHLSQWKCRSIDLEALGVIVPIVRPWAVLLLELVGSGWVPRVWFEVERQACSRSRVQLVRPWMLMTWRVSWWSTGWEWRPCWSLCHCNLISRNVLLLYCYHLVWKGRRHLCVLKGPCCTLCIECLHLGEWQRNQEVGDMHLPLPVCHWFIVLQ